GVGAQGRDGGDAHHDDEGEHDGVLDRGRAVFVLQETDQVLRELTHVPNPRSKRNTLKLKSGRNPNPAARIPLRRPDGRLIPYEPPDELPAAMFRLVLLNVWLALVPRVVIAVM